MQPTAAQAMAQPCSVLRELSLDASCFVQVTQVATRENLPAKFPVPPVPLGTTKAVICILQFPSVEQSSSMLNASLHRLPFKARLIRPYAT